MKTACNCSASKTRLQATSLMEAAMLPALERRAVPLSVPDSFQFVPVQRTAQAVTWQAAEPAHTVSNGENHHPAGRAVLHANGIALPGAGRSWGFRRRHHILLDTGFCAGR